MTDATAKLSALLSAARERRALDDALGYLKAEPIKKTILSTTHSHAYRCLLGSGTSSSLPEASDHDGGKSPEDLAASMRLVRAYAARIKQMDLQPAPTSFGASPSPQVVSLGGGSFRDQGCSFRVHSIRRRQSLSSLEPSRNVLRPEQASSSSGLFKAAFKAAAELVKRPKLPLKLLVAASLSPDENQGSPRQAFRSLSTPPLRRASTGCISTGVQGHPPAAGSQCRLLTPPEDAVSTFKPRNRKPKSEKEDTVHLVKARNVTPPAPRHPFLHRRRSTTTDLYARGTGSAGREGATGRRSSLSTYDLFAGGTVSSLESRIGEKSSESTRESRLTRVRSADRSGWAAMRTASAWDVSLGQTPRQSSGGGKTLQKRQCWRLNIGAALEGESAFDDPF